jgi:phenylacetate-CoA ligase
MSAIRKLFYLIIALNNQWKSEEQLKKEQLKKLKKTLTFAYENVPFYKEKFDSAKVSPKDLHKLEDLKKFPITTKKEIKSQPLKKLIRRDLDLEKCKIIPTSGSTGNPLKMVYDEDAGDFSKAINMRSYVSNGLGPFSKWASIGDAKNSSKSLWFQKIGLFNLLSINLFEPIDKQINFLEENKIKFLTGYPSQLQLISERLNKLNKKLNIKKIFSTAETLNPIQKKIISEGFNCKVIDLFGCIELNRTAWECDKNEGYHIDIDSIILEVVDDKGEEVGNNKQGNVLYTSLHNYAMPLIRYEVGDIVTKKNKKCSCGRKLPLLSHVEGRKEDFLIGKNKEKISPIKINLIFRTSKGIKSYQIIQNSREKIDLKIVPNKEFSQKEINFLINELKSLFEKKSKINLKLTNSISKEGKTKLRPVINNIK